MCTRQCADEGSSELRHLSFSPVPPGTVCEAQQLSLLPAKRAVDSSGHTALMLATGQMRTPYLHPNHGVREGAGERGTGNRVLVGQPRALPP